jgi:di/tricarboxylate transporter
MERVQKTGLGKRIAFVIIRLFKPSYLSLTFALVLIGLVLSVMTPSITVRVAIVIPIAVQLCELCKIEKGSKGNSLIILTAFAMALIPGSAWVTGVLWGPIIQGMINTVPETQGLVTFNSWVGVMFLPILLITVLLIAGSLLLMKPKEQLSKDAIAAIRNQSIEKITKHEIITGLVLTLVFAMFITSKLHGLPDAAICLAAIFVFFLTGVLDTKDSDTA